MKGEYLLSESVIMDTIRKLHHPSLNEIKYYIDTNAYFYLEYRNLRNKEYHYYYYYLSKMVRDNKIIKLQCLNGNRRRYCINTNFLKYNNYIKPFPKIVEYKNNIIKFEHGSSIFVANMNIDDIVKKRYKNVEYLLLIINKIGYFIKGNVFLAVIHKKYNKWILSLPDKRNNKLDYEFIIDYLINKHKIQMELLCIKGELSISR